MANIKQRYIKPGRDFNYSEGIKVLANENVYQDQILYIHSSSGPFLKVGIADANAVGTFLGRLLVAKHDIASGKYGIALPWRLVTDFDTSGSSAAGAPVYLSETTGTTRASNTTFTCPTGSNQIIIGRVTVDATAANGGAMMLAPSEPEERESGGLVTSGTTVPGKPVEQYVWTLGAGGATTAITTKYPIIVTQVMVLIGGAANITDVFVWNGAASGTDYLASFPTDITATDAGPVGAETMLYGKLAVAAGTAITVTRTGGQATDRIIVTYIRA